MASLVDKGGLCGGTLNWIGHASATHRAPTSIRSGGGRAWRKGGVRTGGDGGSPWIGPGLPTLSTPLYYPLPAVLLLLCPRSRRSPSTSRGPYGRDGLSDLHRRGATLSRASSSPGERVLLTRWLRGSGRRCSWPRRSWPWWDSRGGQPDHCRRRAVRWLPPSCGHVGAADAWWLVNVLTWPSWPGSGCDAVGREAGLRPFVAPPRWSLSALALLRRKAGRGPPARRSGRVPQTRV